MEEEEEEGYGKQSIESKAVRALSHSLPRSPALSLFLFVVACMYMLAAAAAKKKKKQC